MEWWIEDYFGRCIEIVNLYEVVQLVWFNFQALNLIKRVILRLQQWKPTSASPRINESGWQHKLVIDLRPFVKAASRLFCQCFCKPLPKYFGADWLTFSGSLLLSQRLAFEEQGEDGSLRVLLAGICEPGSLS